MKCSEDWQERLTEFRKRLKALEDEFSIRVEPAASADDDSNMQTWLEVSWSRKVLSECEGWPLRRPPIVFTYL